MSSLFGMLVYNGLTSIVTKIELAGTEKLFTLFMKNDLHLLYIKEFVLPQAENSDQRISKFLMCDNQLNLSLVVQHYLVYGILVKCKILVFLGFLSVVWLTIAVCCNFGF